MQYTRQNNNSRSPFTRSLFSRSSFSRHHKAAKIKSHMAVHLNSGHDIEMAAWMKEAIESCGGVRGVSVKVCSPPDAPSNKSTKWGRVSYVSNLHYSHDGIRTCRAYDISPWKSVLWTKFSIPEECELPTLEASPSMSEASASSCSSKTETNRRLFSCDRKKRQFRKWRWVKRYPVFCYQFSIIYVPGRGMHQVFHAA